MTGISRFRKKELCAVQKASDSTKDYSYLIEEFKDQFNKRDLLKENTVCSLETSKNGLLLHGDFSNGNQTISLNSDEIKSITLVQGEEQINARFMSPMWLSLKLGIPIERARNFKLNDSEYKIDDTKIELRTNGYSIELSTEGKAFEKLHNTLKTKKYGANLKIIRKMGANSDIIKG